MTRNEAHATGEVAVDKKNPAKSSVKVEDEGLTGTPILSDEAKKLQKQMGY